MYATSLLLRAMTMQYSSYLYTPRTPHLPPHLDLEVIRGSVCSVPHHPAWHLTTGGPLLSLSGQRLQPCFCVQVDPVHHSPGATSLTIAELECEPAQDLDDFQWTTDSNFPFGTGPA